jgi:hypothetical protein
LAVPLTSLIGAGHNPSQALSLATGLIQGVSVDRVHAALRRPIGVQEKQLAAVEDYLNSPSSAWPVQEHLFKQYRIARRCRDSNNPNCQPLVSAASFRNRTRFNGFFFAVNVDVIQPAAFSDLDLFDPRDIMGNRKVLISLLLICSLTQL